MKILSSNNIAPPVEGRCGFFVKRKQRYCKMLPGKGNQYCAEHLSEDTDGGDRSKKRIHCPLDPKHTVFEDRLKQHLKKCNATRKTQLPYYSENINLMLRDFDESLEKRESLHLVPVGQLKQLIEKIRRCFGEFWKEEDLETKQVTSCAAHPVLANELLSNESRTTVRKHLLQQSSLVNILEQASSLKDQLIVIEFGAGRGALSHWVQKAMPNTNKTNKFLLVDRQHNRNKLDCYHRGEDQGPDFERLNIDIQHLKLSDVESLANNELDVTAIGKHLCGGATDLSLKCLLDSTVADTNQGTVTNDEPPKKRKVEFLGQRLHTILFALCCYHRCTWSTYVGREFLENKGFTPSEFAHMTKMAGWSTCGFHRRKQQGEKEEDAENLEEDGSEMVEEDSHSHDIGVKPEGSKVHLQLGLSSDEQSEIGRMCKRLIDIGRLSYVKRVGYSCKLVKYINEDVTPENIALCVTRSCLIK